MIAFVAPVVVKARGETELLDLWAYHQSAAGHSPRTIDARVKLIRSLSAMADRPPSQLGRDDLIRYLSRELAPWSKRTYFLNARSWFVWLHVQGERDRDETAGLPVPRAPRGVPRPMATAALLRAIETAGPRTSQYLTLAAFAGLRACEIAAVNAEDVAVDMITVRGKGNVLAMVPTHPNIWALTRSHAPYGCWFPGVDHGHVRARAVSLTVTKHLKHQGINGSLHRARHWYGTNILRASGGNVRVAQLCLRHASLTSTAIYTEVDDDERTAAVLALPDFLADVA